MNPLPDERLKTAAKNAIRRSGKKGWTVERWQTDLLKRLVKLKHKDGNVKEFRFPHGGRTHAEIEDHITKALGGDAPALPKRRRAIQF